MLDYDLSLVILMELERFVKSLTKPFLTERIRTRQILALTKTGTMDVLEQGRNHSSVAAWEAFKIVQPLAKYVAAIPLS